MAMVFIAPRRYVQGRGVLREIGALLKPIGKRPLLLWDGRVRAAVGATVLGALKEAGLAASETEFGGQSTRAEASRVAGLARGAGADVVVGLGGGKALDTAKAAAFLAGTKTVTVPTIASTDSPTSSYTVWYGEDGGCLGFESWGVNPDLVLVDTGVIAQAPVRSFVAGMGDALSTWIEAEACHKARGPNLAGGGGTATMLALAAARLCYDTILTHGREAVRAVERRAVTPAVEKVVEANVLLSGLGFENGGVATAHMVANCLPALPECRGLMHGEEVGFGVVVQMCLDEDFDVAEMHRVVDFEIAVGLPVTFAELGLEGAAEERLEHAGATLGSDLKGPGPSDPRGAQVGERLEHAGATLGSDLKGPGPSDPRGAQVGERLRPIAEVCGSKGSLCENHPFRVTPDDVLDALFAADALGRERQASAGKRTPTSRRV